MFKVLINNIMELKKYKWMVENWELVAVVIAGFIGLILHALHIIKEDTLLISLILFLLCLYVMRDVSFETANEEYNKEILEKIRSIESRLEENERDMVILMKMIKGNLEKKRRQKNGDKS